jgi:hypothetical protein
MAGTATRIARPTTTTRPRSGSTPVANPAITRVKIPPTKVTNALLATKVARRVGKPARGSSTSVTRIKVPAPSVVKAPPPPAFKLGNTKAAKDPRFTKVMQKLDQSSAKVKEHPPAQRKAAQTQAAAKPPANEKLAGAQAGQVDAMQNAESKKPDSDSFLTLLRAEIEKVMPKDLGATDKFMKGEDKQQLQGAVSGNVSQQKEDATGGIKSASNEPPNPSKIEGKEVQPLPTEGPPPSPPAIGAADAMPASKTSAETSLQKGKDDADQCLADAKITPKQLQKANDPRFSAVLTAKSAVDKHADTAPQKYRAEEQQVINQAATKAVGNEKRALLALQGTKGRAGNRVMERQLAAKAKDEQARKKVADDIQAIYDKTKKAVDTKLSSLEQEVSALFDKGLETAMNAMTTYIDDNIFEWKLENYLLIPFVGLARWLADALLGLPEEVNHFYTEGRQKFTETLDKTLVAIAKLVDTRLKEAKDIIASGQKEISEYVKKQPADLQAVAQASEKEMNGRFDELRQGVDNKREELAQNLAQSYKDANEKADAKLKEKQDENKGLVAKVVEAVGEVIKILSEFKNRILGMLRKAKAAIDIIVDDPIGEGPQSIQRQHLDSSQSRLYEMATWLTG